MEDLGSRVEGLSLLEDLESMQFSHYWGSGFRG